MENTDKYNVYLINPSLGCYSGVSVVAGETSDEANEFIMNFKEDDKTNDFDSFGYDFVTEEDRMEFVYAEEKGILLWGIYYSG